MVDHRMTLSGNPYSRRSGLILASAVSGIVLVLMIAGLVIAPYINTAAPPMPIAVESPSVVVLKSKRIAMLLDGDQLVRTYAIDLGFAPVGTKHRKDDGKTPEGKFRIVSKNPDSEFHRFLGLDYPDALAVGRGLERGLISPGSAASIRAALNEGRCPDWSTALGGGLGLHGHSVGRDWTGGCIALSDSNIEELFGVLRIGDQVEILP